MPQIIVGLPLERTLPPQCVTVLIMWGDTDSGGCFADIGASQTLMPVRVTDLPPEQMSETMNRSWKPIFLKPVTVEVGLLPLQAKVFWVRPTIF